MFRVFLFLLLTIYYCWDDIIVAVLIWKAQDKMCRRGHPYAVEDGLRKLYSEVLSADQELRQLLDNMPKFFTSEASDMEFPVRLRYQQATIALTMAHKVSGVPSSFLFCCCFCFTHMFSSTRFTVTFRFRVSKIHGLLIPR